MSKRLSTEDKAGVYMTVIIHLAVLIVLLLTGLNRSLRSEQSFVIDFSREEELERMAEQVERLRKEAEMQEAINRRLEEKLGNATSFEEKREIAAQYVYMVNDDTGMYNTSSNNAITGNGNGYLISPHETDKTYVEEFSKKGRELVNNGLGSYGWCVTDYGIHFMFVSYIPYDTTVSGVADDLIPLKYIVYYGREDDENDKNKTLRDVIVQDLKSKNTEARYQIAAQNAIAANKDNSISRNKKVWEKTVKELKKSLGVKD